MYPWLRIAHTLAVASRKPRVKVLDTTCVRLRVWLNDLDFNLHVNNGRYLSIADIGRWDWSMRTGMLEVARRNLATGVVGDSLAKFRRDLRPFRQFEIHTRLLGWNHRWGFLEHRFARDNRVIGVVAARMMMKGLNGPLTPSECLQDLGVDATSPSLPLWIQEWNQSCDSLSQSLREEEQTVNSVDITNR